MTDTGRAGEAVSVGGAIRAAIAFWGQALPGAWAPLMLLLALSSATVVAGTSLTWLLILALLNVLALSVAYGAMFRIALGDLHPGDPEFRVGRFGLQWRGTETRLLGSLVLVFLFLLLATMATIFTVLLVALIVTAVSGGAKAATPVDLLTSPAGVAGGLVLAGCLAAIFWSGARLTLSTPATVDRRQIQVFSTWSMTRPMIWTLLGTLLLIYLPSIVLDMLTPFLKVQAQQGRLPTWPAHATAVLNALVLAFVQTPLTAGAAAYFYRRARPTPDPLSVEPLNP